jgi:hypothetical protein
MITSPLSRAISRFAVDALTGFGLFLLIAALTAGTTSFAAAKLLGEVAEASAESPGLVLLAVTFSVLFALNAAFFRHLRRDYWPAQKMSRTLKVNVVHRK